MHGRIWHDRRFLIVAILLHQRPWRWWDSTECYFSLFCSFSFKIAPNSSGMNQIRFSQFLSRTPVCEADVTPLDLSLASHSRCLQCLSRSGHPSLNFWLRKWEDAVLSVCCWNDFVVRVFCVFLRFCACLYLLLQLLCCLVRITSIPKFLVIGWGTGTSEQRLSDSLL